MTEHVEALRSLGVILFVRAGAVAFALVMQVVLARILGVSQYGVYVSAIAMFNLLLVASRLGSNAAIIRYSSVLLREERWGEMRGLLFSSTRMVGGLALVLSATGGAIILALKAASFESQLFSGAALLALVAVPFGALFQTCQSVMRSIGRIPASDALESAFQPAMILVAIGVTYALGRDVTTDVAMGGRVLGAALAMVVAVWLLYRWLPRPLWSADRTPFGRTLLETSFPLFIVTVTQMVIDQVDILLLVHMEGTEIGGIYGLAVRLSTLSLLVFSSIQALASPVAARHAAAGDAAALQRALRLSSLVSTLAFVPIMAGLWVGMPWLLPWFGEAFQGAEPYLKLILVGQLFMAMAWPAQAALSMSGHQKIMAFIMLPLGMAVVSGYAAAAAFGDAVDVVTVRVGAVFAAHGIMIVLCLLKLRVSPLFFIALPVRPLPARTAPAER